jgi:nitrite reductase/ring-hydroxylating ferredoxin subunit
MPPKKLAVFIVANLPAALQRCSLLSTAVFPRSWATSTMHRRKFRLRPGKVLRHPVVSDSKDLDYGGEGGTMM